MKQLSFKSRGRILLFIVIVAIYALIFLNGSFDNIPFMATTVFSTGTVIFAYFAYEFSREKFRLDLFDRRWTVYEATLTFCSQVVTSGSFRTANPEEREAVKAAIRAAHESFRSIGFHKTRALFGKDIQELFGKLDKSYSWMRGFSGGPGQSMSHEQWANRLSEEEMFIWETVNKLPDVFKPYMYFGDYRR